MNQDDLKPIRAVPKFLKMLHAVRNAKTCAKQTEHGANDPPYFAGVGLGDPVDMEKPFIIFLVQEAGNALVRP